MKSNDGHWIIYLSLGILGLYLAYILDKNMVIGLLELFLAYFGPIIITALFMFFIGYIFDLENRSGVYILFFVILFFVVLTTLYWLQSEYMDSFFSNGTSSEIEYTEED